MCMPYVYAYMRRHQTLGFGSGCVPYVYALCVCLIGVPYVYALYVCLIWMPYVYALHACRIQRTHEERLYMKGFI